MNARQWREVAKPLVLDMAAVLAEHGTLRFDPRDVPRAPYGRFWGAVARRDPLALRLACREIADEARRRTPERAI